MSSQKYTIEEIQEKSDSIHNNEFIFIGPYEDYDTPIQTKHLVCGYEWPMRLSGHFSVKKKGCPKCAGNSKLDSMTFQEKSNNVHNGEYLLMSEYKSMTGLVDMKHLVCGNIFTIKCGRHLYNKTGCSKCRGGIKLDDTSIQERLNDKFTDQYSLVKYNGHDNKSIVNHKTCGKDFDVYIHNLLLEKSICPCEGNTRWTQELFIQKSNEIHNNEYTLLGEFINTSSKVLLKHVCGYEWNISPKKHIFSKQGCPKCRKSQGEKEIFKILIDKNLQFIDQHKFTDCKNINELVFDFYLTDLNIAIEFDGIQHFESSEFFGGDEGFEKRIVNDDIKNKYCEDKGIKLIRISYLEDIVEKLETNLNI